MIRQPDGHAAFVLFTQNDHALFSGELARHLGNDAFDAPTRRDETLAAIAGHDRGWPLHDDQPMLNAHGQPLHVFEIPMSLATRIWSASAEQGLAMGDYTGLLVSLHQLNLAAVASKNDPSEHERATSPRGLFELQKFQQRQTELQEMLRTRLGLRTDLPLTIGLAPAGSGTEEDGLRANFRWLLLCDQLSLQLCCGKMLFPKIEGVYPRPGGEAATITTRFVDDTTLAIDPWPFAQRRIEWTVPCRRVSSETFADDAALRAAYAAAPVEGMRFAVVAV